MISLTIIGTVPALVQRTNKQEIVSALQKTYSTLSQAAHQINAEYGNIKAADGGWAVSRDEIFEKYKKVLNNAKVCSGTKGCFPQGTFKYLGSGYNSDWDSGNSQKNLVLADGTQLMFWIRSTSHLQNCNDTLGGSTDIWARCFHISIKRFWIISCWM